MVSLGLGTVIFQYQVATDSFLILRLVVGSTGWIGWVLKLRGVRVFILRIVREYRSSAQSSMGSRLIGMGLLGLNGDIRSLITRW